MPRTVLLLLALAALLPTTARGEVFLSAGAGVFDPWEGSAGPEVDVSVLTTVGRSERFRIGGEFSYRSAEGKILQLHNVDFDSYRLSFVAHYRPLLGWLVEPYLGARLTTALNDSDGKRIERVRPGKDVHHSETFGLGVAALVGIDVPFGSHFSFYGEASFGADLLLIDAHNADGHPDLWFPHVEPQLSSENVGGVTGTAGFRVRF